MNWQGQKIRDIAGEKGLSLVTLARQIGVSRQTINDWIRGQVPKGNHLLQLCDLLDQSPNVFFSKTPIATISVPVHRNRKHSKITDTTHAADLELSQEYLNIFKNHINNAVVPVIRTKVQSRASAEEIAGKLIYYLNHTTDTPLTIGSAFSLLQELGIYTIFRTFSEKIKSYAYYTKIAEHRVVFVDLKTNIIDLIFPLLHEAVHAIRDEDVVGTEEYDQEEEGFCDLVASFVQFPKPYISLLFSTLQGMTPALRINTLKNYAKTYTHSLFGIVKTIQIFHPEFKLNPSAADANLRKELPSIGEILLQDKSIEHFIKRQQDWSPLFFNIIAEQIDDLSVNKIAELFEISALDAKEVKSLIASQYANAEVFK